MKTMLKLSACLTALCWGWPGPSESVHRVLDPKARVRRATANTAYATSAASETPDDKSDQNNQDQLPTPPLWRHVE